MRRHEKVSSGFERRRRGTGCYTQAAQAERRYVRALVRDAQALLAQLSIARRIP
ncbi:MAG: hypothetical protein LC791_17860 [Acidobacteria bacterium]|nr:hypothetical protein [Acidobacteriota bacterium]